MKHAIRYTVALLLAMTMLLFSTSPIFAAAAILGDTDGDGNVTLFDATVIQTLLAELICDQDGKIHQYGNIDGDDLSIVDVVLIQRFIAGCIGVYPIGKPLESDQPTSAATEPMAQSPTIVNNKITVCGVTFDVSKIPDAFVIDSSKSSVDKTFILTSDAQLSPEDVVIQVNNGVYDCKIDYSDERFKENYLMTNSKKPSVGYDCLVRNKKGEEAAWVSAHYEAGMKYPFRVKVFGLAAEAATFPIDFYYKDVLIRRCMVTVHLQENESNLKAIISEVRKIEQACWTNGMTDEEKLKALSKYVADHYPYSKVMCVTGALFVANAARDLGLTSMLLYPTEDKDVVTYNIYFSTTVPGGHCACLVKFGNRTVRYDVQGGNYRIREY